MTTRWPGCVIVMELAAQLKSRSLRLETEWSPRDLNVEADRLSNLDYSGFEPALRVRVPLATAPWLVLPELMNSGREFLEARQQQPGHASGGHRGRRRKPKEDRLRARDPW